VKCHHNDKKVMCARWLWTPLWTRYVALKRRFWSDPLEYALMTEMEEEEIFRCNRR
jgi:hypothetical protein